MSSEACVLLVIVKCGMPCYFLYSIWRRYIYHAKINFRYRQIVVISYYFVQVQCRTLVEHSELLFILTETFPITTLDRLGQIVNRWHRHVWNIKPLNLEDYRFHLSNTVWIISMLYCIYFWRCWPLWLSVCQCQSIIFCSWAFRICSLQHTVRYIAMFTNSALRGHLHWPSFPEVWTKQRWLFNFCFSSRCGSYSM